MKFRTFVWLLFCLVPVVGLMGAKRRPLSAEMAKKVALYERGPKEAEVISAREEQSKNAMAGTGEAGGIEAVALPGVSGMDMPPIADMVSSGPSKAGFLQSDGRAGPGELAGSDILQDSLPGAFQKGLFDNGKSGIDAGIVYQSPKEELAAHENEFKKLLVLEKKGDFGAREKIETLAEKVSALAENQTGLRAAERARLGDLRDMVNTHVLSKENYKPTQKIAQLSYSEQEREVYNKKVEALVQKELKNLESRFGTRVAESIIDQEMLAILRNGKSKQVQCDRLNERLQDLKELGITPQNKKQKAILAQLKKISEPALAEKDDKITAMLQDIDKRSAPESNFIKNFIAKSCGCPQGWVQFKRARAFDKQLKHLDAQYLLGVGSAEAIDKLNLMKPVTDRQIALIRTIKTFITDNQETINRAKASPEERVAFEDRAAPPTAELGDMGAIKAGMGDLIAAHKKLLSFQRIFTQNKKTVLLIGTALAAGAIATVLTGGAFLAVVGGAYMTADKATGGRLSTAAKDAVGNLAIVKDTRELLADKPEVVLTPEQVKAQTLRRAALSKRIQDAKVVLDTKALVVKKDEGSPVFKMPGKQPAKVLPEAVDVPVVGSDD